MSALRDWFRRRPSSAEYPPYQPVIIDPHLPPDQQPPQAQHEASWLQWGYPAPTQYAHPSSHAPTPSFDTVMAVALSESASEADQARAVEGQEATDMLRAKQLSLSISSASGAAEALSFKLWDTDWCVLPSCLYMLR